MASTLSPMSFAADLRISVSMATFDDNFIALLRNAIEKRGDELDNVELQVEDAKNEVGTQLNQIQNSIAADVDAIIVSPVDTDATVSMNDDAQYTNIPLVYVNHQPINVDLLPDNQAFIASNEIDSGTLQTKEVCRLMEGKGEIVVLMGALTDQTGIQRTQDIYDVLETDECSNIKIVEKQTGLWQRTMASDIMTNWLSAGVEFDGVIANNDEMAIVAIQALKAVSKDMDKIVVAGVDATQDALQAMREGDLDVTVFQDPAGQGAGSVDIAVKLANGEDVPQEVWVPFELVVPSNMEDYANRN
ncbi:sugar ABC transporter substrate-binding protein [Marinomonas mediterranea]|jgi:monosaccharide ABC transporter substrate-binding protein, CUT2 family (TC 3.A.1.2.-)|uniref:Sugar ABC transporter periplasmic protein n=1 Tax=Marinomonas mediterranea (strain ATCC 700492 / JCM 21426 / NBRC 103028 / MMB-1) TaxID=717774 RepID=F2K350_MARM1|nr:sugar ABC transporter substrate-binding protein [Marinomonas mediterranea]ADZ90103.1 sugar ABC transporter periplasmic protein [Marinomonas mediterranea MMB-1]WCN16308.1 substrate-binding domain-containing protein [Marinomonas mediterranea MMB-1]